MKTINPLHLLSLLFVIFIFILFQLSEAKKDLFQAKQSHKETLSLATSLNNLNKVYSDKKAVRRSIATVLKQNSLRSANIKQSIGKSSITMSSKSMDKVALNSFMSKILNGSYNVHAFKIKKLSENRASLWMEIKW